MATPVPSVIDKSSIFNLYEYALFFLIFDVFKVSHILCMFLIFFTDTNHCYLNKFITIHLM